MLSQQDDLGGEALIQQARAPGRHHDRLMIEASPDAVVAISPEGKIIDLNESMIRLTGAARTDLLGSEFSAWFTDPVLARELCPATLTRHIMTNYPLVLWHRDGNLIDAVWNAGVYRDDAGEVCGICATGRDVTESRSAELRFRMFIESAPDAMLLIGGDGTILLMNRQSERLFGYHRDELIGGTVEVLVPERLRTVHAEHRATFFRAPRLRPMGQGLELWGLRKDGSEFPIEISLSPIETPQGSITGAWTVGATVRDVTVQRAASRYARGLLEATLDPLVTISLEGKITDVNEATIKATGVAREKLIGTDFSDYFTEPKQARDGTLRVFAEGSVTDCPLTIRHETGRLTEVLYNASLYKDLGGNVLGAFAAARDVTEARRIIREFAETKSDLDNILQSSIRYSIIGKDLGHRIMSWNEGALRNYGYTADEILGRGSEVLHTPEDRASGAVKALMAAAYESGFAEGEFERVRKDGSRFWANVAVTRRADAAGSPTGFLVMSNDISERKRAEEQVHSASLYARSLIEASLDPFVTISPEGKITDVNEATAKITGVPREQLVGTEFCDYFTRPDLARLSYQQVFADGSVTDYPLTIRHRDQGLTEVMYNASIYKDVHGNVLGAFAGARDITSLRRVEAEIAEQRGKELERLAELERFQKVTVGRELKMMELKREIQELKRLVAISDAK